jgi:chemotaxis methyl-accepting protein methylase
MQETDYDLIQEEREHQYRHRLQRRMAMCGTSDYPGYLARQEIIEAEQERLRIMGVVDISEVEE